MFKVGQICRDTKWTQRERSLSCWRSGVTRGVFYSVLSLMEVLLWSADLAERTDFVPILAWFFLQDGLQRSRTGSVDFTDGGGKFLCSLRALFGLVEENSSIGSSSSCA